MATLKQYFDTDLNKVLSAHQPYVYSSREENVEVIGRVLYDFDSNTYYLSYYVPICKNITQLCLTLVQDLNWAEKVMKETIVQSGGTFGDDPVVSTQLHFSGRVFIYSETDLHAEDIQRIKEVGMNIGRAVHFRGPAYAVGRSRLERPLAFISHDSRDKDEIARPLALRLTTMMCPVWYDEYSLKLGSSLRESIETGLKECKKCILVLTPNFLSNTGWTKTEFNSIFTREILESANVVLPIWHGVSAREVYEYSPSLADKVAIEWSKGIDEVPRKIYRSVTS
jgi:hypothetical protein